MNGMALQFLCLFVLGALLAFDSKLISDERDVYVFFIDARKFGGKRDRPLIFRHIDPRCEDAAHAAAEPVLEERVDLRLEDAEVFDIAGTVAPAREP
jgi:hypothetical protein